MVDSQLRAGGVYAGPLLSRFAAVPRELFVPQSRRALAYVDDIQWFGASGNSRFMPPAALLGKLLRLAEIAPAEAVLDVGASSGYATAIVAGMAATATALETDAQLATLARTNLSALTLTNTDVLTGDAAALGHRRFDVIFMQGMVDSVPEALLDALAEGGRLVALVQAGRVGVATVYLKSAGQITVRREFNATLPQLSSVRSAVEFVF